jgi:hypothetical protein
LKTAREYKTGLITACALFIFLAAAVFLKTGMNRHQRQPYFVTTDPVTGIAPNDKVLLNGRKIGYIAEYRLLPGHSKAIVKMMIDKDIPIPKGMVITFDTISSYKHGRVALKFCDSALLAQQTLRKQIDRALMILDTMELQLVMPETHANTGRAGDSLSSDTVFQVQIGSFRIKKPLSLFSRSDGITLQEHFENGYYKYTLGCTRSYEQAVKLKDKLIDEGYEDAFIVAYRSGIRISLNLDINIKK